MVGVLPIRNGGPSKMRERSAFRRACARWPLLAFQRVRRETRHCHQEQLHRYRFRHHPLEYLASLEKRWEQTVGT